MPTSEQKVSLASKTPLETALQQKQRHQMYLALSLLFAALVVVVAKDWKFWFSSEPLVAQSESEKAAIRAATAPPIEAPVQTPAEPVAPRKATATKIKPRVERPEEHVNAPTNEIPAPSATITATNRAALPPLQVEVVAGDQHLTVQPINRSVKVDLHPGIPVSATSETSITPIAPPPADAAAAATNASERVRLSADTAQMVERPVEPNYPMLAKQMKVQGSVVLQALIGKEGSIQDLRVLSGPAILSSAAMDAVRQWRFHPYYQSGQTIETEARITVNFTISTY